MSGVVIFAPQRAEPRPVEPAAMQFYDLNFAFRYCSAILVFISQKLYTIRFQML